MRATEQLHRAGQSLWLDNITRAMLDAGQIQRYIDHYSVTGLTSNPSIFDKAIGSGDYDETIRDLAGRGITGEDAFYELALEDLCRAADAFLPIHQRTAGVDGWVSLEISPVLADDTEASIAAARRLHGRAARPNLFIKVPGTPEGIPAIRTLISEGIPVNVTLCFSAEHYLAAADAYLSGIEARVEAGLDPVVGSVVSVFLSRFDVAVAGSVPSELVNRLGLAIGGDAYRAYREVLDSDRFQRLANEGARPQRLLFASTGTKDPAASDILYVRGLSAPNTIDTMPGDTLEAFYDHGELGDPLPIDGHDAAALLARYASAGVDPTALAAKLQVEGAQSFVDAWNHLLERIATAAGSSATPSATAAASR
jgi:transaldolase